MSWATIDEVFGAIQPFRPDFTDNTSINVLWHASATAEVNVYVVKAGYNPVTSTDQLDFLKLAEICFYFEIASQNRQIEFTIGGIAEERLGRYSKKFDTAAPMFFFAQGKATEHEKLIPHDTWRTRGIKLITGWTDYTQQLEPANEGFNFAVVTQDSTIRGEGWDTPYSDGLRGGYN